MKKFRYIVMALALIMSLTQCKKNYAVLNAIDDNMIDITINVDNNSRIDVTPGDDVAVVTFKRYDRLHIVSDGKYCGYVEKVTDVSPFTGKITAPTEGVPMYIYFLGEVNKHHEEIKVGATSCKVDITDQTAQLPVISCGRTAAYLNETASYSVTLNNKCALVKFEVTTSADKTIPTCLTGLQNEMIIDFQKNTFTPDTVGSALIKLKAGSGERWAILLPHESEATTSRAYSEDYRYVGTRPAMNAIHFNDYITNGYEVTVKTSTESPTYNDKKFSLSPEKRVSFSKGNVQHVYDSKKGVCVWKFAEHQYDVLHNENTQQHEGTCNRDRFGWGTGNNPDLMSHSNSDYPQSTSMFIDWGSKFPEEGRNPWFTPKCVEWRYLMFERPTTSLNGVYNARYARARVAGVNGVILFPDVYNHPSTVALPTKASINYTTKNDGSYSVNDYTVEQWNKMEAAGAVFLPVTGYRQYTNNAWEFSSTGEVGHYWTQCDLDQNNFACDMYFTDYRPYVQDHNDKCKGFAVRLVRE